MKQILSLVLLLFICLSANAQDVITTRKGAVIQAKVTEVTPSEIKYKRFDNLDGPNYTAKKSEIASIVYKNGTIDAFSEAEIATEKPAAADKPKDENPIRNEITLGVNGGFSFPIGAYGSNNSNSNYTGNADSGNTFGLDFGSNFKGSRFGWLLTGFLSHHYRSGSSTSSGTVTSYSYGTYSNSGILLGATYRVPLKNRSAFMLSLQLGHIGAQTPGASTYIETGSTQVPETYQRISTNVSYGRGGGFLFDLGASYRLHFPKTHFYMLGKLNYQTAGISITNQSVRSETTIYNPSTRDYVSTTLDSYNSFTSPYAVINMQLGIGFFLK
jgi:hypothetical protein